MLRRLVAYVRPTPRPLGRWQVDGQWEIRADLATLDSGGGYAPAAPPAPAVSQAPPRAFDYGCRTNPASLPARPSTPPSPPARPDLLSDLAHSAAGGFKQ